MGFASIASIQSAWGTNRKGQKLPFQKTLALGTSANLIPHTGWTATGFPGAGAYPTSGVGNGAVLTSATTGALPYNDASAGEIMHLISLGAQTPTAVGNGVILLIDRIAHIQLSTLDTGALTGLTATSRLEAQNTGIDDGAMLFMECTVAFSAAANTYAFTYTNQAGTGSKVTPTVTTFASAQVGRSPFATPTLFLPLAAGDRGVRSVQSVAPTGSATGNYALSLVRPLAWLPLPSVGQYIERDAVMETSNLAKIFPSSCLSFIYLPVNSATPSFIGEVRLASG